MISTHRQHTEYCSLLRRKVLSFVCVVGVNCVCVLASALCSPFALNLNKVFLCSNVCKWM